MRVAASILSLFPAAASAWVSPRPSSSLSSALRMAAKQAGDTVPFAKYEGLGNDFVLIDQRAEADPVLTPEQSAALCNRNFGIGGDGVIFALKPPSDDYDFSMRIYNSDGSEPEMCGNGIRCLAAFLKDLGEDGEFLS